jgi:hypothetical protein
LDQFERIHCLGAAKQILCLLERLDHAIPPGIPLSQDGTPGTRRLPELGKLEITYLMNKRAAEAPRPDIISNSHDCTSVVRFWLAVIGWSKRPVAAPSWIFAGATLGATIKSGDSESPIKQPKLPYFSIPVPAPAPTRLLGDQPRTAIEAPVRAGLSHAQRKLSESNHMIKPGQQLQLTPAEAQTFGAEGYVRRVLGLRRP